MDLAYINALAIETIETSTTVSPDTGIVTTSLEAVGSRDHTINAVTGKTWIGVEACSIGCGTCICTQDDTFVNVDTRSLTIVGDLAFFTLDAVDTSAGIVLDTFDWTRASDLTCAFRATASPFTREIGANS